MNRILILAFFVGIVTCRADSDVILRLDTLVSRSDFIAVVDIQSVLTTKPVSGIAKVEAVPKGGRISNITLTEPYRMPLIPGRYLVFMERCERGYNFPRVASLFPIEDDTILWCYEGTPGGKGPFTENRLPLQKAIDQIQVLVEKQKTKPNQSFQPIRVPLMAEL